MSNYDVKDSLAICQTSQGVEFRASLLRLTRYLAVLEVYDPNLVLQLSEALQDVRIIIQDRTVYSGRAVVSNLMHTSTLVVVEVKLDESAFALTPLASGDTSGSQIGRAQV